MDWSVTVNMAKPVNRAKPGSQTTPRKTAPVGWFLLVMNLLLAVAALLVAAFCWIVPIEVIEQWAFDRAGQGTFDRFEAIGQADFFVWVGRIVAPLWLWICWSIGSHLAAWEAYGIELIRGLAAITRLAVESRSTGRVSLLASLRTYGLRGLLVAWGVLWLAHAVHGLGLRGHDWPYFRFHSGEEVLPNISDSNRLVIRYLREVTPPTARILVASDQKLFFLSYYLRPRFLLHRMHPDSEHVIPLKDQQRKLAAFRLEDLTAEDLVQMPHDYRLEYFEHPDLVDQTQVLSDTAWVAFVRRTTKNPSLIPPYLVRLRKVDP